MPYSELKTLLNPSVISYIDHAKGRVQLEENTEDSKLKPIWLNGLSKNAVVFKLDKENINMDFIDPGLNNIYKRCDYIIISSYQTKNVIIFCELKSNSHKGAKQQLHSSIPFIDFIASLLNTHYEQDIRQFKRYFVLFSTSAKARTSSKLKSETFKGIKIKLAGNPSKISLDELL